MEEKKIGDTFSSSKGDVLLVEETSWNKNCKICYFHNKGYVCAEIPCSPEERSDATSIVFIKQQIPI